MVTFEDLPNEIIGRILDLLPKPGPADGRAAAACIARVNRRLYELALSRVWRSIKLDSSLAMLPPITYRLLTSERKARAVRELDVCNLPFRPTGAPKVPDQTLKMWRESEEEAESHFELFGSFWRRGWPADANLDDEILNRLVMACGSELGKKLFPSIRSCQDTIGTAALMAFCCPALEIMGIDGNLLGHPLLHEVIKRRSHSWSLTHLKVDEGFIPEGIDGEGRFIEGFLSMLVSVPIKTLHFIGTIDD